MSNCQYYDICPSASGWCINRGPEKECVPFLLTAIEKLRSNQPKILYECDRRACKECKAADYCGFTRDIRHAKNFHIFGEVFVEGMSE